MGIKSKVSDKAQSVLILENMIAVGKASLTNTTWINEMDKEALEDALDYIEIEILGLKPI